MILSFLTAAPGKANETARAASELSYIRGRGLLLDGKYEEALPLLEKAREADPTSPFILNQLAETYLRLGNFEKAEFYAEAVLQKEPNNLDALINYGGILNTLKKHEEAKKIFRKIIELDPSNNKAPLLLAIIEAESGNIEGGIRQLTTLVESNPENIMAYFYRAKLYIESSDLKKATLDFEKCLALRPSFIEAGTALGILFEREGNIDAAISTYSKIQGVGAYKKRLAQLYLERNQFDKALNELSDYEQYEPDDYTARVKVGLLMVELKRLPEARDRFLKILGEQPQADNVRFYLAAVFEELKDYAKALSEFKKISKQSSFFKEATLHIGFAYKEIGKYQDGLRFAKKILEENPDTIEFYDMQASFHEVLKDNKSALSTIEKGLKRFPKDEKLLYFEAALYDKTLKREMALSKMKKLLEINPKNPHALNFVGYTYAEMNQNLEEAKKLVTQALEIRPNDGFIIDSLGWICFKLGQFEEAEGHLEKALALQPKEAVILEHLGDVYLSKKDFARASTYYKQAIAEYAIKKDKDTSKKVESKLASLEKEKRTPSNENIK